MTWSIVNETGIDYAPASTARSTERLCFPTVAAQAEDGSYLIGDELGVGNLVPYRFEGRTIRVDADHNILYDTLAEGMNDAYGCFLDGGSMAILRRTKWELWMVSPDGRPTDCFSLATLSKRMPRYVSWTSRRTFLIVFLDGCGKLDIVEMDRQGRLLWYLPRSTSIGIVGNAQLLPSGNLLIADPLRHVASEIDRGGNVVWQFGHPADPSGLPSHLASPGSVRGLADGRRVIADTRNHRVLSVSRDGTTTPITPHGQDLIDPRYADVLRNGNYLICDTGNARVIELDGQGRIVWSYGEPIAIRRRLSYPRSVDVTGPGRYLIADTAHDRIVEVDNGRIHERPFHDHPTLFWPRCVRTLPGGSLLIADARNRRIVEVSAEGRVLKELWHLDRDGRQALKDPHDVRMLPNGHLLVTDSPCGLVAEVDWSGRVHRLIGEEGTVRLDDPHSAEQLDDGRLVISDTGHHRIVVVDQEGKCVQEIDAINADSHRLRLHHPRYAEVIPDGTMAIADTGHNRILAATTDGDLLWELSCVPHARLPHLNQPRWVKLINRWEVVVCDHFHHRVLHVRYDPERAIPS